MLRLFEGRAGALAGLDLLYAFGIHRDTEGGDELGHRVGLHETVAEKIEDRRVQVSAPVRLGLVAGSELTGIGAGEVIAADRRHGPAISCADDLARQQVLGTALLPEPALPDSLHGGRGIDLALPGLHLVP
nr:hypothetical protein [Palleronia aestuarii]